MGNWLHGNKDMLIRKDHAAGSLLVAEAGGKVSDMHGAPLDFGKGRTLKSKGVIAGSNGIFDQVISAVRSSL